MARSTPPEYVIDILFRAIDSPKVNDERRKEFLEEAFLLAPLVEHPYRIWTTGFHADRRETMLSAAMRLPLDTLAVRSRVIRAMLKLDPERAMEMLNSLPPLQFPKLPCDAKYTPHVAIYYETLAEAAKHALQDEEFRDEMLWFLEREIQTTHSSIQIPALGKALKDIEGVPGVFEQLAPIYIARVGQISDGCRAFGYAATRGLQDVFLWLLDGYQSRSLSPLPVWTAFRSYISRHLKEPRCEDMVQRSPYLKDIEGLVEAFDTRLAQTASAPDDILPISEEEARPGEIADGPSFSSPWDSPRRKQVTREHSRLRHGEQWRDEDARLTPEWRIAALTLLREAQNLKLDFGEDEIGLFHLKVRFYAGLFDMAPTKELRETIADALIEYMSQSTVSYKHPTEFLWLLSLPLRMARTLNDEAEQRVEKGGYQFIMLPNEHGYLILEKMRRSHSPVLQVCAKAEEILPQPLANPHL